MTNDEQHTTEKRDDEPHVSKLDTRMGSLAAGAHYVAGPTARQMPLRSLMAHDRPSDER